MSNILDLSGSDTSGFTPVDPGSYNASVFEIELAETSGSGKLPQGVQMVKVQFSLLDAPNENRRVFTNYVLPTPSEHDNSARFLGSFVNFLVGVGEDETKLKTKGFDVTKLKGLEGRECVIRVAIGKSTNEYPDPQNVVKGVKVKGSPVGGSAAARTDLL